MVTLIRRLVTLYWFLVVASTSIIFFMVALILRLFTYPFDRRLRALHMLTCFWASCYTWIMPSWRITVRGRDRIRRNARYVVVSNHQSQLDILVAFRLFFHYKWVSKIEIFKVPFIGWNMVLNRYVKLKRGDKVSVDRMMADCDQRLSEGSSVYLFPEGTRSPDGVMKPFKLGAFILAHQNKTPILPIVISGTNKALPKYQMNIQGINRIIIQVLDEIPYAAFERLSIEETSDLVRGVIMAQLDELNKTTMA